MAGTWVVGKQTYCSQHHKLKNVILQRLVPQAPEKAIPWQLPFQFLDIVDSNPRYHLLLFCVLNIRLAFLMGALLMAAAGMGKNPIAWV